MKKTTRFFIFLSYNLTNFSYYGIIPLSTLGEKMFAVKKLFLIAVLAVLVVPNAMANVPSTAYVQEIVKSLELKPATETELGGVKQGDNVTIASDGKISVHAPYTLPVATTEDLGGVKQGDNVTIASDGVVSVATGTPSVLGVVRVGQIPSGSAESTTYATIWVE